MALASSPQFPIEKSKACLIYQRTLTALPVSFAATWTYSRHIGLVPSGSGDMESRRGARTWIGIGKSASVYECVRSCR